MALTGGQSKTRKGTLPNAPRRRNIGRNNQRTVFRCGHRGLGIFCHRCAQAKVLQDRAAKGVIISWNRKVHPAQPVTKKASKEQVDKMLQEAKRLLSA